MSTKLTSMTQWIICDPSIRCILACFYYRIPLGGFFVYFSVHIHVYIRAFGSQMNTSVIHNMVIEPQIRATIRFSLPNLPGHIALV
jgi:hypothetical protein